MHPTVSHLLNEAPRSKFHRRWCLLTLVLPEPARRSLEDVSGEDEDRVTTLPREAEPIPA